MYIYKWADITQHEIKEPYYDQFSLENKDKAIRQSNKFFLALLTQSINIHVKANWSKSPDKTFLIFCACPKSPSYLSFPTTKKSI